MNLYSDVKKFKFNINYLDYSKNYFIIKYKIHINIKKLDKLKDNFTKSLTTEDNIKNLNALKFINLVKIWTNYIFQNIYERIKKKRIKIDLYYL
jgi:hypothetical protein